jgi:hypothetical protein
MALNSCGQLGWMSSENSDGEERQAKGDKPAWTLSQAAQSLKVAAIAQLFSDKSAVPVEAGEGGAELGDAGGGWSAGDSGAETFYD